MNGEIRTESNLQNTPNIQNGQNPWNIPIAIVIAGALIAGAVYFSGAPKIAEDNQNDNVQGGAIAPSPVTDVDHILGNKNAKIKIIEYSDFECPYCKSFHSVMKQVIDAYGKDGQVAWIYRHFPIEQHTKAKTEAIASECIAELGGNDDFWRFADRFFELSPSNDQTDLNVINQIVKELNIDSVEFNECMTSGKYDKLITDSFNEAIKTGGTGTPWSIIVTEDGELYPVNGLQSFSVMKEILDTLLK